MTTTPLDLQVEVKTEIEEPICSNDEDNYFGSFNGGCDSNSQNCGDSDNDKEGRSLRKRKIKSENLAESSEEEEDDDEWTRNKKKKRGRPSVRTQKNGKSTKSGEGGKKRTAMSVEEKKERERERKRLFRLKQKEKREMGMLTSELGEKDGEIKKEIGESDEEEAKEKMKRSRSKLSGSRKKRVSEMTEEEKERKRALWRQQAEKKRAKRRELEGREKQRRGGNRKPKPLTPELLEFRRLQRNKWIREYRNRVKKDPEKWRRFKEKDSENRKLNRMRKKKDGGGEGMVGLQATLTEEERERRRMAEYFRKQARLAGMTEEERGKKRAELREKNRLKWEKIKEIPGEYEKIQEKRRKWREGLRDEKKERFLEKLRENARKQHERWRKDPVKWQELKDRWRVKRQLRKVELEAGAEKKKFEWSEAVKKKIQERVRKGKGRQGVGMVLTEEENRRRLELRRLADKKRSLKKKLWIQGMLDVGMSIEQIMQQTETPEHRSHRLSVQRIAKAKRDLRKRLQKFGTPQEEIQQKVIELERTYQPCKEINRYRQSWKRVDPKELEELDEKLKIETEKFNELLKSNRSTPVSTAISSTTATTSKIIVSSTSPGKMEIIKNKSHPQNFIQVPSTISNIPPSAPALPPHTTAFNPPLPTTYFSHQDFLHQFSFQSHPPPPPHFYPQTTSTSSTSTSYQPHSLQNILHTMNMKYQQDNPHQLPSSQTNYHEYSSSSSHHGYENSSYGGDDEDHGCYSPPASHQPVILTSQQNPPPQQVSVPPPVQQLVEGKRPRAKRKPSPSDPPTTFNPNLKFQSHPRTKRDQVIRDVICDQCGKPFNNQYIRSHTKIYHNPNYEPKSRTCLLCNVQFPMSSKWYQHYVRDHLQNQEGQKDNNPIICDLCGKKFKSVLNYNKHSYFTHGDGLKQENRKKCPFCPEFPGRFFKENSSLQGHIARFHPGRCWVSGKHVCWRCEENFRNDLILRQHVRDNHVDSYFCCEFCGIMKYSRLSLNFHWTAGKCSKMPKGWGRNGEIEMVEDCEYVSLDKAVVPCEICGKGITVKSLMKHYRLVHNIVERQDWKCGECGKGYKRREGMVVHMEEAHGRRVDKDEGMREMVSRLNQENREGLRLERKKKEGWGRKVKMERGEWEDEEETKKNKRTKGRRRRIKVICEEDGGN